MPKRRMLSPLMWQDPEFGTLNEKEQLLFIGCLSNADDEGRLRGHPALLKATIFPYSDITVKEVQEIKIEVSKKMKNFLIYNVNGDEYIQLLKWTQHQTIRPDRMTKSVFPLPDIEKKKAKEVIKGNEIDNKINIPFNSFWNLYDKKTGLESKIESKWNKLTDKERDAIMKYIPKYIKAQPEKRFRKNPETFFNNRSWEDEIISNEKPKVKKPFYNDNPMVKKDGNWYVIVDNKWLEFNDTEDKIEYKLV